MNDFNTWLTAKGFDPEAVTAQQRVALQAQWRAESNPPPTVEPPAPAVTVESGGFEEQMAAIESENARIDAIRRMTIQACENNRGNPDRIKNIRALCDQAVANDKTTVKDFQLALFRTNLSTGPLEMPTGAPAVTGAVVEAALCRAAHMTGLESRFDARTLEASDREFKGGLGLQDLLAHFARRNGWRGSSIKAALGEKDFFRAAFGSNDGDGTMFAGTTGPSTYSLPQILSNVANKFLRVGFESVDGAWRMLTAIRSVSDFKQTTTATLTGSLTYRKLAPSGEIRHGTLSELAYTNQAATYAIMLGIARTDLINDDLNALSTAGRRIGRGAGTKINDIFWTVFLNNSSFFTSGNANVSTGAGSALASAGLKTADRLFRVQTDQEGLPVGSMPKILLVPPTLWYTARELMNSSLNVGTTTANSLLPATNIFQGSYQVVTSPYMENSTYTGNSTAAWYLLADPNDLPVIETVFLNGRDTPTVDTAEADFNQLGIAMRGYVDFGCALQEYRGGVRSAGS